MQKKVEVVAEIGLNHNGDVLLAKKLIGTAISAGADMVKFQAYKTEDLLKARNGQGDRSVLEMCQLDDVRLQELFDFCEETGIEFMATPFSAERCRFLDDMGQKRFKIASGCIFDEALVDAIVQTGKPIIFSTGMIDAGEVRKYTDMILGKYRNAKNIQGVILMQCTSEYPCSISNLNMGVIYYLERGHFNGIQPLVRMGFSDHSTSLISGAVAVGAGCCMIEKHITFSKDAAYSPDHTFSLNAKEFREYVANIRRAEAMIGNVGNKPTAKEMEFRRKYYPGS